jgi:hypothetical protein
MPKYFAYGLYVTLNEDGPDEVQSIPCDFPYEGKSRDPVQAWKEYDDRYGAIQFMRYPRGFDLDSIVVVDATWRWDRLVRDHSRDPR